MVGRRPYACGFSLIEIMITLLLVGVLGLMAGPFTVSWLHLSEIQRAKGQLIQAHGIAKAAALRNRQGLQAEGAVVAIRVDGENNRLALVSCPDSSGCSEEELWAAQLPSGVTLSFTGLGSSEIEFDNTGRLIGSNQVSYQISKGKELQDGILY